MKVLEHGLLEGLPGGIGRGGAADGTLGDAGVGGTEAFKSGLPSDLPPLFHSAAQIPADQQVRAGDPSTFEGVNDHAAGIAEDGVVEEKRLRR